LSLDTSLIMYIAAGGLLLIGSAGIVLSTHLVRIIFGIALLEAGANLLLLLASFREGAAAPIIVDGQVPAIMADPVPQALVLTAIVIGVGILALALSLAIRVQRAYGTLDMREIRELMAQEIADDAGIDRPVSSHAPLPVDALTPTLSQRERGLKR
jgi:multisubunit Na+/H+ antiporter MnhC subunit